MEIIRLLGKYFKLVDWDLGAFARSRKAPVSFVMYVRLSTRISAAATGRIAMKLDTGDFMKI
jgi:hypothetical protein